jgi:hypothetical protein
MNEVPVEVKAAARAAANGTQLDNVALDLDDGTATYELSGKGSDGKMIEVDELSDGRIEEVEQEIGMDAIPEAVKRLMSKHMPNWPRKSRKAHARISRVYYEFDGQNSDGQELDVEIRSDGKRIIIQDDAAA